MKKLKLMIFAIIASILFMPVLGVEAEEKTVNDFDTFKNYVENANSEDVIKLAQNITNAKALTINKSVTIDLNGHTYEGSASAADKYSLLTITGRGVEVTIKDSGSNGKIQTKGTEVNSKIIRLLDHAELTFNSGTVANNGKGMVGI